MIIKVPATSANLGPGFDSIGIAVSLYLTLDIRESTQSWFVEHDLGDEIPTDESNMIIATALQLNPDIQPHHVIVKTDIPVARGLGSSSTAIVAGIQLADQLGDMHLSVSAKMKIAAKLEGHPDNVAPALYGGLVIGANVDDQFEAVKAEFPDLSLVAYIPSYELKTSDSRNVLPATLSLHEAAMASAIANTFVAALLTHDLTLAGKLIENDQFHEPYRQALVPELLPIRQIAHETGAVATYLSGAGPTVMTMIDPELVSEFQSTLINNNFTDRCLTLSVDRAGSIVI